MLSCGYFQRSNPRMILPTRSHDLELGEYCYRITDTISTSTMCSVVVAEEIAAVISALMNTSGGVLQLLIEAAARHPIDVEKFGKNVEEMITQWEKWIPVDDFAGFVKQCPIKEKHTVYFFVAKPTHTVTLHTNAFYFVENEIRPLKDYMTLCGKLRSRDDVKIPIALAIRAPIAVTEELGLATGKSFECPDNKTYQFRMYELNGRTLLDVLGTESVKCELRELVSALANSGGGSLMLGVTDDTHPPRVKGYTLSLDDTTCHRLKEAFSEITLFELGEREVLRFHKVACDEREKFVIEIYSENCPGGMFCAMPLCFEASEAGDVAPLGKFEDWKKKMLQTYESQPNRAQCILDGHFVPEEGGDSELPVCGNIPHSRTSDACDTTHVENVENPTSTSEEFPWWLASDDGVVVESLQFKHSCAKEIADDVLDMTSRFTLFPLPEKIIERHVHVDNLRQAIRDIELKYGDSNGAACVVEDAFVSITAIKEVRTCHVCDVIILRESQRPSIVSIMKKECDATLAKRYSMAFTCALKRECLRKNFSDSSTHLSFERHLYYLGIGFDSLGEKISYPNEYMQPTLGTLNIVRYFLAKVLLHCEPLQDRFGDIMVRHLSACQARVLWDTWSKVNVVEGKAGSGKTVLLLETMRRITQGKHKSKTVALCRGRGLAAFIQYQNMKMGISETVDVRTIDKETLALLDKDFFCQYTDIFVDDAHSLPMEGEENCQAMYRAVFSSLRQEQSRFYIFLDPCMQDYRGCVSNQFTEQIRKMAREYPFIRRQDVKVKPLGRVLRNCKRICQFMGMYMPDDVDELRSIRNLPEDGVFVHSSQDLREKVNNDSGSSEDESESDGDVYSGLLAAHSVRHQGDDKEEWPSEENTDNQDKCDENNGAASVEKEMDTQHTLLSRLRDLLKGTMYQERHITVVTENKDDKTRIRSILADSGYSLQDATIFPVKQIVVDTLENFEGLESPAILFVLPESWATGYIGSLKYRLCIASRAISRLEFLVPWDTRERQQDLAELRRVFRTQVKHTVDHNTVRSQFRLQANYTEL